jgi:hypothetical protein
MIEIRKREIKNKITGIVDKIWYVVNNEIKERKERSEIASERFKLLKELKKYK